jgi:hypothetical protein
MADRADSVSGSPILSASPPPRYTTSRCALARSAQVRFLPVAVRAECQIHTGLHMFEHGQQQLLQLSTARRKAEPNHFMISSPEPDGFSKIHLLSL